jgi:hypothetical protein
VFLGACASNPTTLDILVSADGTVPPVTSLQVTISRPLLGTGAAAPEAPVMVLASSAFRSLVPDTDAGVAEPFHLPAQLRFNATGIAGGPATVRVDGFNIGLQDGVLATGTADTAIQQGCMPQVNIGLTATSAGTAASPVDGAAAPPAATIDDAGVDEPAAAAAL